MAQNAGDVLQAVKSYKDAGTSNVAFERAYEFLVSRKKQFSPQLEELVILFLDLAIEGRNSRHIKDVLQQFKNSCHSTNYDSLVTVSRHLIKSVEAACQRASDAARGDAAADGSADPMDESVEASILRAVSGDLTRDRTERTVLQPWLRFAWDVYVIIIRTVRAIVALERHLQDYVMQPALDFCKRYRRPGDFRRLSAEIENAQRRLLEDPVPGALPRPPVMNAVEFGEALLKTRFLQLDVATSMDLWVDVERVTDSLQELISRRRPTAAAGKLASQSSRRAFYAKLADVFWLAQNKQFHAIALLSHTVALVAANSDPAARRAACTAAVLAIVCVPFWLPSCAAARGLAALDSAMQRERELAQRLSRLLMRPTTQSRTALLHDLMARGFLEKAEPEAISIYRALEAVGVEASPLTAAHDVKVAASALFERYPALRMYESALYEVAAVRVLQHTSGIFRTVSSEYLLSLLPQFTHTHQLEELLCEVVGNNVIGFNCCIQQDTANVEFRAGDNQIDMLASALPTCAARMLDAQALLPRKGPTAAEVPTVDLTPVQIAAYTPALEAAERAQISLRKGRILEQRAEREKRLQARHEEVRRQGECEEKARREEEEERQRRESAERSKRKEEEAKAAQLAQQNEMLLSEAATTLGLSDKLKDLEKKLKAGQVKEVKEVTTKIQDALVKQQAEVEKKRQDERLRMEHYVRECRQDEAPILREWIASQSVLSEEAMEKRLKEHRDAWERDRKLQVVAAPLQQIVADHIRAVLKSRTGMH